MDDERDTLTFVPGDIWSRWQVLVCLRPRKGDDGGPGVVCLVSFTTGACHPVFLLVDLVAASVVRPSAGTARVLPAALGTTRNILDWAM
mmetsp:Transcript_136640/g.308727  ORF Transcript_136640/g.308727 Transcript_136640/m.308727 type:complete len:89 (-) Transcript_136640:8-274(-)